MNRYKTFIKIVETGSFSRAAETLGYTQSALSQMVRTLEKELSTTLLLRSRTGITLTADGREYLPYIQSIANAQRELEVKFSEMQGLQSGLIRIGTFTSVSRTWLPRLMKSFKERYPYVQFVLQQGDYSSISQWVDEGTVDFGFTNPDVGSRLTVIPLCVDRMKAVLPVNHPLADEAYLSLETLAGLPYILLDEGEAVSVPLTAFGRYNLSPNIQYTVVDDYTIMSMVEQGLGVSILYDLVLEGYHQKIVVKPIRPTIERTLALTYKNKKVLPIASRYFIDYILDYFKKGAPHPART